VIPAALAFFGAGHGQQGVLRLQEHRSQTSGDLPLSVVPGILGSLVAEVCGRGVEPAAVGRVLAGPAGRTGVRWLPPPR
jgi:hypothetical protein